jgi:hypothetical protein
LELESVSILILVLDFLLFIILQSPGKFFKIKFFF